MMLDYISQYRQKLKSPEEAVKVVKSGDWVDYTLSLGFPKLLDEALAKRRDELTDVKIRGNLIFGPIQTVESDPNREHFIYNSWHCSSYERKLFDRGLCSPIPMVFRNYAPYYKHFLTVNVAMISVTPMDRHGYFNLSCSIGGAYGVLENADYVIVEVNENLPRIYGGFDECIHISQVDCVVEGEHDPILELISSDPTAEDMAIAKNIIPHIVDGATIQLGIGSTPNAVGTLIAQTDVKDLGMHTELCSDAYLELFRAGKLTNRKKQLHRNKGVTGIVLGSRALYDWVNENPSVIGCPLEYVNDPGTIAVHDNMVSINSCIAVDLYGQISSETSGFRHISGTGGQLDFLTGASMSSGGKAFICMKSYHIDSQGVMHSNVKSQFGADIVTVPRSQAYFIVTEQGIFNLEGMTTWERAEGIIGIAHPDFRDQLIKEAEKQKIWIRSNKR